MGNFISLTCVHTLLKCLSLFLWFAEWPLTGENVIVPRKFHRRFSLSTTNPTCTELASNLNFHREKPVPVWDMECLYPSLRNKKDNFCLFVCSGVCHADELGYLIFSPHLDVELEGTPEETVRSQLVRMWTNFAKTGWVVKRKQSRISGVCLEYFFLYRQKFWLPDSRKSWAKIQGY